MTRDFNSFLKTMEALYNKVAFSSNSQKCKKHEEYQQLHSYGRETVLNYITELLNSRSLNNTICNASIHIILCMLYDLVGENGGPPIPDYYRGRIAVYKECWHYWLLENGYGTTRPES